MKKLTLIFLQLAVAPLSWASTANCNIEIEDVNAGTKYNVEQKFTNQPGSDAQRKHFKLPGSNYSCTLAFFNLESGTMLSCQFDELGQNFVQSDRSIIGEGNAKNNLSFRYESSFFVLHSSCK
ncbi:MAG TPA: hypothetical protein ENJ82_18020 [Bacteroidetes bacterium]|nr:hypothetical protein [Bacteroidota bacterium]